MKVYVVSFDDRWGSNDQAPAAVFSTLELAKAWVNQDDVQGWIDVYDLDTPGVADIIVFNSNGGAVKCS